MNRRKFLRIFGISAVSAPLIAKTIAEPPRYTIWSGEMEPMGEIRFSRIPKNPFPNGETPFFRMVRNGELKPAKHIDPEYKMFETPHWTEKQINAIKQRKNKIQH